MESNISKDHIALEAMKVLMEKGVHERLTLKNMIKRFLGIPHRSFTIYNERALAEISYKIADAMIAEREKGGKQ